MQTNTVVPVLKSPPPQIGSRTRVLHTLISYFCHFSLDVYCNENSLLPGTTPPPEARKKAGRRQSTTGLMQRVCNAPFFKKELPATLPSTHLTHANSLHTATAVPQITRQSQTAQAGVAPSHYLFFLLTWPLFFFTGRGLTACASALGAHFRLRQLGRGRGALWRLGGRHLHLVGRGVRVRFRVSFGYRGWLRGWVASVDG